MEPNPVRRRAEEMLEAYRRLESVPSEGWAAAWLDPGFVFEDRRSMSLFGNTEDRESYQPLLESLWVTGEAPTIELGRVVASRGHRLSLGAVTVSFGDGVVNTYLTLAELDESGRRFTRWIDFDADDEATALVELDRLAAEYGDPS